MNILTITYKSTNYFLVDCKGGKLMVDCGWPDTYNQFAAEFKRKGASPQDVKYVLVTHFHPDHAGLVQEFKNLGAKFILMESQINFMASFADFFKAKKIPYTEITSQNNILLKFTESRAFLTGIGLSGEILSTPGHSDDSVALILDEGYAFVGDMHPTYMLPEADAVSRASWERVYQHKITRIFTAHG